jgi:hypothetical protein
MQQCLTEYLTEESHMVLANFLVRIEIPDWMDEAEQDAMLAALDRCKFKKRLLGSAVKVLAKSRYLSLSDVKVED